MAKKMNIDYKKLGFKCGIEIHQQMEGKKLFCSCPTSNIREGGDIKISRKLRAVIGETGQVDAAAAEEMAKGKSFHYIGDSRDVCLVEMDEEPPHPINPEAVKTALVVAKLLNAKVVDEIQVMRKTVVDGSNTSGFQRTALVAYDGFIETSKGRIRIPTLFLEEEACQRVKEDKNSVTYRLDRLGIPLLEIATEPDIKDNEHAKETAEKIGMILRSTGKMKRGIGTIRQDVNVSIRGRNRIEIKGFQDLKSMPLVIDNEIKRQQKLKKKEDSHVRRFNPDGTTEFLRKMPGAARMYPETDIPPFKVVAGKIESVELIEDKVKRFEKIGLGKDLALLTAKSGKVEWFEEFAKKFKSIKPAFIAETLVSTTREIRRKFTPDIDNLTKESFEEIFSYLNEGKVSKESIMNILIDYAKGDFKDISKYALICDKELEKELKKIVEKNKGLPFGALMGIAMKKFRGKAEGKKISEILKKLM